MKNKKWTWKSPKRIKKIENSNRSILMSLLKGSIRQKSLHRNLQKKEPEEQNLRIWDPKERCQLCMTEHKNQRGTKILRLFKWDSLKKGKSRKSSLSSLTSAINLGRWFIREGILQLQQLMTIWYRKEEIYLKEHLLFRDERLKTEESQLICWGSGYMRQQCRSQRD